MNPINKTIQTDLLTEEESNLIKRYAGKSEEAGTLSPELLELAYQKDWFKLFVPEVYGGPGKRLPEILRLEEEIAAADGSLGWTVTLCSGAGWFAGFLDPELAQHIFAERTLCFAGSGAVGGTAMLSKQGYIIDGSWKYASGATHATIFTANCYLLDEQGNHLLDHKGAQVIKSFILKKDEVTILPGWSYFGLVATGSHAFKVEKKVVPLNRTFDINQNIQVMDSGFDYPFLQLAETTLTVNSTGMARHFLTLLANTFYERSGQKRYTEEQVLFFEQELKQYTAELEADREDFYLQFDLSWGQLMEQQHIDAIQLEKVSKSSRKLAHTCRRVCDLLFPYAGLEAAKKETEINRVWRDIHTASQHALLTFA